MPQSWQRICCAVDFSECSRAALDQAVTLARQTGAALFLVHVLQPPLPAQTPDSAIDVIGQLERSLAAQLATWQQAALEAGADHVASEVVISHSIASAITYYAVEHKCDVIILGTHGRGGFKRWVLGSVAELVVRNADVPVLVVHPHRRAQAQVPSGA